MFKLTKEDIQAMWERQLTVLSFMTPSWILSSASTFFIFIALESLENITLKNDLMPMLISSGLVWGVCWLCAASLYVYLRNSQKSKQASNSRLLVWLYGAYNVYLLNMTALMFFRISYIALRAIGLRGWLGFFTIASYMTMILIVIIFAPSIWKTNTEAKIGLGAEKKLGLAFPTFILTFGLVSGQVFVRMVKFEIGLLVVSSATLIISYVMAAIGALGVYVFIVMALQGFSNRSVS